VIERDVLKKMRDLRTPFRVLWEKVKVKEEENASWRSDTSRRGEKGNHNLDHAVASRLSDRTNNPRTRLRPASRLDHKGKVAWKKQAALIRDRKEVDFLQSPKKDIAFQH